MKKCGRTSCEDTVRSVAEPQTILEAIHEKHGFRLRAVVACVAALVIASACRALAAAQTAATPAALASALPIVGDPHDTRGNNLVVLDSIVFLLGVSILGGVLVWWGLRIYKEK